MASKLIISQKSAQNCSERAKYRAVRRDKKNETPPVEGFAGGKGGGRGGGGGGGEEGGGGGGHNKRKWAILTAK